MAQKGYKNMKTLQDYIDKLNSLNFKEMYNNDFFWTWDKTDEELEAVFTVADALRFMRENNISTKVFESGLGISIFRDNSTRTRFSFASACFSMLYRLACNYSESGYSI